MTAETFVPDAFGRPTITKDPKSGLDYYWNWSDWLALAGDTIKSVSVTSDGCAIQGVPTFNGGYVKAVIVGGTAYVTGSATCEILTNGGLDDRRTVYFKMVPR